MADHAGAEKFIIGYLKDHLKEDLTYHGVHHTLDVLEQAAAIAEIENLDDENVNLLRVAACLHDIGFVKTYKGHEEIGCNMANEFLPRFGFSQEEIKTIGGMINATKLPQQPNTLAEKIIADADLDYLGRDDFYSIGNTLFEEFKTYHIVKDEKEWNRHQLKFLIAHHYHTDFSIQNRNPEKLQHLREIKRLVDSY